MRPHRQQPTRLPRPWDSPGKNTGVGCHVLLQCMKGKSESEVTQLCSTLSDPMDCSLPVSSVHGVFQARVLEWGAQRTGGRLLVIPTGVRVMVAISPAKPIRIPLGILKFGSWKEQGLFTPQFADEAGSTRPTTLIPWGHSCSLAQGSWFYPHLHGQQPHLAWTLLLRTGILWKLECLLGWISIRSFSDRRKLGISTARADESLQEAGCLLDRGDSCCF